MVELHNIEALKTAWVFPGQGSQVPGMGKAIYEWSPGARALYEQADELLGYSLSTLCFEGPAEELQQTNHAQPALLVTELAHLAALRERYGPEFPDARFVAGHSLGEYSALVAASALEFEDALRLVTERGRLMQAVGQDDGVRGGMSAVIGLEGAELQAVCDEAGVDIANLNAPGQIVISGPVDALERAGELAKQRGARRVVPLPVSAAFHSRWMVPTSEIFADSLSAVVFTEPRINVVANVTAEPVPSAEQIRSLLEKQTYSPVRWTESIECIAGNGVTTFIEIGPGKVLTGLTKRIVPEAEVLSSEDLLS